MIADLAPAEVHLVATAREPLGLFTASWQESLKNRSDHAAARVRPQRLQEPERIWNWRTLDLRLVLRRWARDLPPSTCTCCRCTAVAPVRRSGRPSPGSSGVDPAAYDTDLSFPNESMGVVEAETLRRINEHLASFERAFDRGVYIRTYLADERLVPARWRPLLARARPGRGVPASRPPGGRVRARARVRRPGRPRRPARPRGARAARSVTLGHRRRGRGRGRPAWWRGCSRTCASCGRRTAGRTRRSGRPWPSPPRSGGR